MIEGGRRKHNATEEGRRELAKRHAEAQAIARISWNAQPPTIR
jgi:hypothetical protein